jgi:hypothetical protein
MHRINNLSSLSMDETQSYLSEANGDEITAAYALACDRNSLAGSNEPPDDTEVHHALYLMRRARGLEAPSFDSVRMMIKGRAA